jgi:hypothetical protein
MSTKDFVGYGQTFEEAAKDVWQKKHKEVDGDK